MTEARLKKILPKRLTDRRPVPLQQMSSLCFLFILDISWCFPEAFPELITPLEKPRYCGNFDLQFIIYPFFWHQTFLFLQLSFSNKISKNWLNPRTLGFAFNFCWLSNFDTFLQHFFEYLTLRSFGWSFFRRFKKLCFLNFQHLGGIFHYCLYVTSHI